jgi:pSer/pThr/pTyr-binding forkhead associated (FHA) protein
MLLTILLLCMALACAAIGVWAMRRPQPVDEGDTGPIQAPATVTEVPARPRAPPRPQTPPESSAFADARMPRPVPASVARAIAFLDFDGLMGRVEIERPEVVIGRHSQDDIRINDVRVSRHHARLVAKRGGGFEIHNLTSDRVEPNPMQINGATRAHADIADGDVVTLGGVSFVFRRAA